MRRWSRSICLPICVLAIASFWSLPATISAQLTPAEEKGLPPNSVFHLGDVDAVNLQNGNLHISIPILSLKQRGGADLTWALVYDSPGWAKTWVVDNCPPPAYSYMVNGDPTIASPQPVLPCPATPGHYVVSENNNGFSTDWRLTTPSDVTVSFTENTGTCPIGIGHQGAGTAAAYTEYDEYNYENNWTITDWQGTAHPLPIQTEYYIPNGATSNTTCLGSTLQGPALDGSGAFFQADPNWRSSTTGVGVGYTKDGAQFLDIGIPGVAHIRDANGNLFNGTADTLNRNGVTTSYDPSYQPSNPLSRPQYVLYAVHDSNGASQQYRVDYATIHFTSSICSQFPITLTSVQESSPCQEVGVDSPEISQITLPDGKAYVFHYNANSPGEIAEIDLPTGATITYSYGGYYQTKDVPNLAPLTVVGSPAVSGRTVAVDGRSYAWLYNITPGGAIVTDPDSNVQTHYFSHITVPGPSAAASSGLYEMEVISADMHGHVLRTVDTNYDADLFSVSNTAVNVRPIRKTTTLDNGLVSKTETDYETFTYPCVSCGGNATGSRLNPTEVREFGYGSGAPGALLRKTDYAYLHSSNPTYVGLNIVDKPTSITVYDGAGTQVSQTINEYDNYARSGQIMQASGAVRHDATYGTTFTTRGNLTARSQWLNTTGGFFRATNQYDDAGNVLAAFDPLGNRTSYSFADSWSDEHCAPGGPSNTLTSGLTMAFPTLVTNALGQSVSITHNSCTGTTASATDPNGNTTTVNYDLLNRPKHVAFPDGGTRDNCYSDDPNGGCSGLIWSMIETTAMTATTSMVSTTIFDGLGRAKQTQINSDPQGVDYADTVSDDEGKVVKAYNPYRGSSDAYTTYTYDALGRKLVQTNPDGTTVQLSYNGNVTTSTDEAGNQWQRVTDALGRLTSVTEPDGAKTTYSYSSLGDLKCVDQWGTGAVGAACSSSKSRSFNYDSLSRLLSSTNPETGTVSYGYTASGSPCAGDVTLPCIKTDARGVTTTYSYDVLNRMTFKHYSDGTPVAAFGYDGNNETGIPLGSFGIATSNAIGRLSIATNQVNSHQAYAYDPMGRVSVESIHTPSIAAYDLVQSATYDLAGNMTSIAYPDGRIVDQVFNGAGRLAKVSNRTAGSAPAFDFVYGSSTLSNPGDTSTGGMQYTAAGAPQSFVLGNGVGQFNGYNSRLQPCHTMVSTPILGGTISALLGGTGPGNLLDRESLYSSATSPCGPEAGNNGNIHSIVDNRQVGNSQSFSYDSLNRLLTGARSDDAYNHTYNYDSFGNMLLHDNLASASSVAWSIDQTTNRLLRSHDGGVTWGDYSYDAGGNLHTTADGIASPVSYQYNANNQVLNINSGQTASYLYDAMDQRVFKQTPSGTTDYIYFNNQPIAEKDQTGAWTDYIYANGQKVARLGPDTRYHLSGTVAQTGGEHGLALTPPPNLLIQPNDRISWRQFNHNAVGGIGVLFDNGGSTAWSLPATDGQFMNQDSTEDQWLYRTANINAYAGSHINYILLLKDVNTPVGNWFMDIADITIIHPDGSIVQIPMTPANPLVCESDPPLDPTYCNNIVTFTAATDPTGPAGMVSATHYYLDDHLGTTQMELSAGGWPVWQGQFTPFGGEIVNGAPLPQGQADGSSMHYKFTGKERDAESGLDYFGARYYASSVGRWTSPDWAEKPEAVPYSSLDDPQSLDLYQFVRNNPLSNRDSDGHRCPPDCGDPTLATEVAPPPPSLFEKALKFFYFDHPNVTVQIVQIGSAFIGGVHGAPPEPAVIPPEPAVIPPGPEVIPPAPAAAPVTTENLLTGLANQAVENVGPGRGAAYGTAVHSEFEGLVNGVGRGNLSTEVSYLGGKVVPRGTAGSVRVDVAEGSTTSPTHIYDLKTGSAELTPARIRQIQSQIPGGSNVPVTQIRPTQ